MLPVYKRHLNDCPKRSIRFSPPQGWTEVPIAENPHALLGVICAGLCFMQPLIALTRCHPDHRRRPLFNWVHWFVGNAAQARTYVQISLAFGPCINDVRIFFGILEPPCYCPTHATYQLRRHIGVRPPPHQCGRLICIAPWQSSERCMDFRSLSSFPSVVFRFREFHFTISDRGCDSVFE